MCLGFQLQECRQMVKETRELIAMYINLTGTKIFHLDVDPLKQQMPGNSSCVGL